MPKDFQLFHFHTGRPVLITRDVQIIAFSIFGPCCDDVIALALEQYLGPCNNGNEAVEEMPRSVKISILS